MEIQFSINNRRYSVCPSTVPINTSLNTFIRSFARLTGTKFMCLEGGCGVCIVNISGLPSNFTDSNSIAVNSCLWMVYSCHGLNITTIEGLGSRSDGYHPIQQLLWEKNGSQCGYCSPAMVMNMYSLLDQNAGNVTMNKIEDSFGGNICRCTGYRPILDAFKSIAADSPVDIENASSIVCCRPKVTARYRHASIVSRSPVIHSGEAPGSKIQIISGDGKVWHRVETIQQLLATFSQLARNEPYILISGNTAHGVYRRPNDIKHFIDINPVAELHIIISRKRKLIIGANVSLSETIKALEIVATKPGFSYCQGVAKHINLIANVPVRNTGTIAGNLSIKHMHNEFSSDLFLVLETIGAKLRILSPNGSIEAFSPKEYLLLGMRHKLILDVVFPQLDDDKYVYRSYKIMPRAQNAHAFVNAAFLFHLQSFGKKKAVVSCRICYGGIHPRFIHAEATEDFLTGIDDLYTNENVQRAIEILQNELTPDYVPPDPHPEYRRRLAIALFYRFCLSTAPNPRHIRYEYRSGANEIPRPLSSGIQSFDTYENKWPLTEPVLKNEGLIQCAGEAKYSNDIFGPQTVSEELWGAFVQTSVYHEKIVKIDASRSLEMPGVYAFYSAKDIPGKNSFISIDSSFPGVSEDEKIFLDIGSTVLYNGQPCGMIVARSMELANAAASQVKITYKKLRGKEPLISGRVLDVIDGIRAQTDNTREDEVPETTDAGDVMSIEGELEIGTQYHFPLEPQTTVCFPTDDGGLDVFTASQWYDLVQIAISQCLNLPENKINITVKRIGGAYGSKLARSSLVACACALATHLTNQPVRFVMTIEAMMSICGKRYPCANKYSVTVNEKTGKILTLDNFYVEDYGYTINETNDYIVLQTFLLSYVSNNWKYVGEQLLTNTQVSNWCRAPGTIESVAMVETIIEHIAHRLNVEPTLVRLANMDERNLWKPMVEQILQDIDYFARKTEVDKFNRLNRWRKRGIAFIQMKYPIEYIGALSAYVAIFHGDGTVIVSHGGVECGQGINTKAAQMAAYILDIPLEMVHVKATNNETNPNCTFTAASAASDSVCLATKKACEILLARITPIRNEMPADTEWRDVINECHRNQIDLTAKYSFIPSDSNPYFVYGCACAEIEWDALTGKTSLERIDLIEDTGRSMSPLVDIGQIEGAFVMGLGYWLSEKYVYDRTTGQLLTNRTWNYKPPGAMDIPIDFRVKFIETDNTNNRIGVLRSKATGEPAAALSFVVVCALRHALNSVLRDNGRADVFINLGSGLTPDELCSAAPVNIEDFLLY